MITDWSTAQTPLWPVREQLARLRDHYEAVFEALTAALPLRADIDRHCV